MSSQTYFVICESCGEMLVLLASTEPDFARAIVAEHRFTECAS